MADKTLLENNEILTVQDEDSFVGIYFNNGHFDIRFPIGYKQPDEIPAKEDIIEYKQYEKQKRKDILTLVKVLSANDAVLIANQEANSSIDNGNNFPFYAYNFVYKYYKKNGYYIPKEKRYKKSDSGKINWNRTIKQINPVVSDKNIVYLETIRNKTNYNDNELIAIINRYCVYQSYLKVGCLFSSKMVKEEKLKVSIRACIKVLNRKIRETFNSDELNLFRNMKKILETENNDSTKNEYYFGTNSFHTIWEAMVNDFYGIPKFIRTKFNPTSGSTDAAGEQISGQNSTLRPDTIAVLEQRESFKPNTKDRFTIVVFIEGDDPDCKNDLLGGEIKMHMDITEEHLNK